MLLSKARGVESIRNRFQGPIGACDELSCETRGIDDSRWGMTMETPRFTMIYLTRFRIGTVLASLKQCQNWLIVKNAFIFDTNWTLIQGGS